MGVERIPVTGERDGSDASTSLFCFQFKNRRALPDWLFTWMSGICGTAIRADKIGVLVLKVPHMKDADALVVLRWGDWVALHGQSKESTE